MVRFSSKRLSFAVFLASLAGFVDSIGFLSFGGLFFSFMSGNTTKLGANTGAGQWTAGLICLGVVFLFVFGVVLGTLVGRKFVQRSRSAVLGFVAGLLLVSALGLLVGRQSGWLGLAVVAMGAMNTAFDQELEGSFGFTFVTGALVRAGQRIGSAVSGEPNTAWVPYVLLWSGLAGGALLGAVLGGLTVDMRLLLAAAWGLVSVLLSVLIGDRAIFDRTRS